MEKRYFLYYVIVVVYLCIVAPARADTTVGGSITAATTWTKEESPYLVTETVEVIEGVTLTIEPGVKAVCNRDTGLVVWGQLIAAGTQEEMIEFASAEAAPSPGDWDGICFKESSVGATVDTGYLYQSGSILSWCKIEYAGPAVTCELSAPYIANCTITNNSTSGSGGALYVSGDAVVIHNTITDNKATGVLGNGGGVYSIGDTASIINNYVKGNYAFNNGGGLFLSGDGITKDNIIVENSANGSGGGLYIHYGVPTIEDNGIADNATGGSGGGMYNHYGESTIQGNSIHGNAAELLGGGIYNAGCSAQIRCNSIVGNRSVDHRGGGIYYANESMVESIPLPVHSNNLHSNEGYDIYNATIMNISAEDNCWGVTDTTAIEENIFDIYDNTTLGPVSYDPIVSQPHTVTDLFVLPSSHHFGSVGPGGILSRTFTAYNLSTANRMIGTLSITGTHATEFAIQHDNCSGQIINPLDNCTIDVVFSPTLAGTKSATLGIPSDNPDVLNVEVVLSGTGTLGICLIEQIYGYESEEVKHLRSFRDKVLCSTPGGQEIIKLYYAYSPLLVEAMEADGAFKQEMRGLIDMSLLLIRGKVD